MEKIIVVIVILVLVFVIYFLAMGKRGGKTEENEVPDRPTFPPCR